MQSVPVDKDIISVPIQNPDRQSMQTIVIKGVSSTICFVINRCFSMLYTRYSICDAWQAELQSEEVSIYCVNAGYSFHRPLPRPERRRHGMDDARPCSSPRFQRVTLQAAHA